MGEHRKEELERSAYHGGVAGGGYARPGRQEGGGVDQREAVAHPRGGLNESPTGNAGESQEPRPEGDEQGAAPSEEARLKSDGGGEVTDAHPTFLPGMVHRVRMSFGKHVGILVTRIPHDYLTWAIGRNVRTTIPTGVGPVPFCVVARAEISRRGHREQNVSVSAHAVDRASFRCLEAWQRTRKEKEGLMSWLQRMTLEAIAHGEPQTSEDFEDEAGRETYRYEGFKWAVEHLAIPVLLSVM